MISDTNQVIVTTENDPRYSVRSLSVHHRDFPELRGNGESPEDAAVRLAELLTMALDSAPSAWRRGIIEHAIEDVQAFAERDRPQSESVSRSSEAWA